jgi:hypothetical protein
MELAAAENVGIVTASVIFGAFILKLVDLVKYLVQGVFRNEWNGFLTMTLTWAIGIAAIALFIETPWGDEIKLGDQTLDQLNFSGKLVFALAAPAIASLLYDAKKAVDRTDTASTPRLTNAAEAERHARMAAAGAALPPAQ